MTKYNAQKAEYLGHKYDSKLEASVAQRLDELTDYQDDEPHVDNWDRQIKFELLPKRGKERAITYKADFLVRIARGLETKTVVIEVKGYSTAVWRLKRRLFLHLYPEADLRVVRSVADLDRIVVEDWQGR